MANGIFFTKQFWPTVGGISEHSHQMAKHLTELGENITLLHYVSQGYEGDDEFDRNCGYPVVRFSSKVGTGRWYRDPWARTKLLATLLNEARRTEADYIVYNGWDGSPLFNASLAMAPRLLGVPAYVFIHSSSGIPPARSRLQALTLKALLRSAAGVITVSRWARPFLDRYNIKPGRAHVIRNGIDLREADSYLQRRDPDRFSHLDQALPIGYPNIVCVARLHPNKRMDRLIRVMPLVLEAVPEARLAIAGIGKEEEHLRQLIADSPAKNSITLLGLVTGDEKLECYARCSVFALTSDYESLGLVLLEAGAFGKPVVTTAVGGSQEAIEHGGTGLLVERCNSVALADAIVSLLKNPDDAHRMGENGRRRMETEFTWKQSAAKLRAITHEAIGQ